MEIENNKECFVMLWRKLERTRRLLGGQYKRFCVRRVLQSWLPMRASNNFIWEICNKCEQGGYDELPMPQLYPRPHREFLRAFVSTYLGIGMREIDLKALDGAYSEVFPNSTPLNVNKKLRTKTLPFEILRINSAQDKLKRKQKQYEYEIK